MAQAPVRELLAAIDALWLREKCRRGAFRTRTAPAKQARDDDYTGPIGHGQTPGGHAAVSNLPPQPRWARSASCHALQEWEGYVVSIGKEDFEARLIDLTARATYEGEEATIPLRELSDRDAGRLRVGAIFRWVIGYQHTAGGSRRRVSQIVFRDLGAVTKADLRDAEEWARSMAQWLNPQQG